MIHIGISGPIAAGKTTLAQQLCSIAEQEGYAVQITPFASGIRELIATEQNTARVPIMAGLIASWGWDAVKAHMAAIMIDEYMRQYPSTPGVKNRRLLQYIGTEIGRNFIDQHFWIYRTQQLLRTNPVLDFALSDDLRFDNEAMAVDVHVRIALPADRTECYQRRLVSFGSDYIYNNHASERSLTLPPLFTIPVCFTSSEVKELYVKLDTVRKLRY